MQTVKGCEKSRKRLEYFGRKGRAVKEEDEVEIVSPNG
jgi:hypothetical protein